jgi:hypothetical protein
VAFPKNEKNNPRLDFRAGARKNGDWGLVETIDETRA